MATPTPSTNTPQKHLAALSSPAPRSVPPMNFDSPAVLNMLSEGGVGMGISMSGMGMSQLGLTASQLGRADEDERRRRLESIIAMLNKRSGRVGEEGIIALCKKEGVEFERSVERDGSVVLTLIIGNEAMCDITLQGGDVTSVKLELASDEENIFKESGSRILYKSLTPPTGVNRINLTLDQFGQNLEKLLRMDKLSAENGGVPCYKAIFGVYGSLKRLFEHEKKIALALVDAKAPNADYEAEREVLCKKSGRPRMNAGTCLGLSLEYWMDRRHIISTKKQPPKEPPSIKGKEKMDIDSPPPSTTQYPEDTSPTTNKIYSLAIECESSPSSMYTPIRIPPSWISSTIEKAPDAPDADINNILLNTPQIDWLDPKPTYLEQPTSTAATQEGDADAMNLDNAPGRLPNIRFVAKFNPPLVVPLSVYISIMQSVGLEYNPQDLRATTFVGLAIRPEETDPGMSATAGGYTAEVRSETNVLVVDADDDGGEAKEKVRQHANSLYVPKLEYSRTLEALPFAHPRQLVELLPTLRQYAFATSVLWETFGTTSSSSSSSNSKSAAGIVDAAAVVQKGVNTSSPLSPPLTPPTSTPASSPLHLDISLSYTPPSPRLTVYIPHPSTTNTTSTSNPSSTTASTATQAQVQPLPTDPADLLAYLLSTTTAPGGTGTGIGAVGSTKQPLKVVLDILPNAEVYVSEQNVISASSSSQQDADGKPGEDGAEGGGSVEVQQRDAERVKRVGRALEVCGDLGVWGEWVSLQIKFKSNQT